MRFRHLLAATVFAAALPLAALANEPIKIGFPIPLSGPTAVYGVPILKGAELAVADINAAGGVLGRKLELLPRDSKANPAEAVRLSRELIVKNGVQFLGGTLTSAEAPAVSTIAKENHVDPGYALGEDHHADRSGSICIRTSSAAASNTTIEGEAGAIIMAKWKDVKTVATVAPDYAYGHDAIAAFLAKLKELRPDIPVRRSAMAEAWRIRTSRRSSPRR